MRKKPNIILCTSDQLRAFALGCYGNDFVRTPNLDRLAADGVRFETAVTNFPVCMAARSVLLSGQYNRSCTGGIGNVAYPSKPGDHNMPEYPEYGRPHLPDPTLAEGLLDLGYHTAVIGKWHIHSWPHEIGFDEYLIPRVHHCHSGQSFTRDGGPEFVPPGFSVDYEADQVEAFLAEQKHADRPFFLYYNISTPHCPVADAPALYLDMYAPAEVPLRQNVEPERRLKDQDHWFKVYRYDFRYYNLGLPYTQTLPDGYSLRHLTAEYYGVTTWMDDTFGRLLDSLDVNGLAEDTLIVFTADHGDNLGSHGLVQKGGPTEESVRIPLIARWPGELPAGRVVTDQVGSLVDIAPSLLSLAGGAAGAHMHGEDLSAVIRGQSVRADRPGAFIETSSGVGVRTPSHLYYLAWEGPDRTLREQPTYFFDIKTDPYQMENLAGFNRQGQVAAGLDETLRDFHKKYPFLNKE
jgi:choline-sulfatase